MRMKPAILLLATLIISPAIAVAGPVPGVETIEVTL